jgi:hypothetical protein
MYVFMCIYTHEYTHTYIHIYIHTYIHTRRKVRPVDPLATPAALGDYFELSVRLRNGADPQDPVPVSVYLFTFACMHVYAMYKLGDYFELSFKLRNGVNPQDPVPVGVYVFIY